MKSISLHLLLICLLGQCSLLSAGEFSRSRQKLDLASRYRQLRMSQDPSPEEELPDPEEAKGMQRSQGQFRTLTPGEQPDELFDIEPRLPLQTDE
ncbi:MAG: hypothetical protein K1000chlam4_00563 [Chlamydiae bacterium]|nr:hypothetical protein [Chlamydiota bacterium]